MNTGTSARRLAACLALSCFAPLARARAQTCAPPSGLVGWWKADGNALDATGANNGTAVGNVTYVQGVLGQAFHFDGTDWIDATDTGLPLGNSPASFAAWIRTTQTGEKHFFTWGTRNPCGGHELSPGIYNNHFILESCGGHLQGSTVVNDGAWHHVAAVWFGGSSGRLYVDGVRETLVYDGLPSMDVISSGHVVIGRLINDSGFEFAGDVDEAQVYNRTLADAEVLALSKCKGVPFASFDVSGAELRFGKAPGQDGFEIEGRFKPGAGSSGISPASAEVVLAVGTFTATLPAGSLSCDRDGECRLTAPAAGLGTLKIDAGRGRFEARARDLSLIGTTNELTVSLRIGEDFGHATVRASGSLRHVHDSDESF